MGKIKRIISLVFATLLVALTISACGCVKKVSEDEAKALIKNLVDASYELNVAIYEGLPYYERSDAIGSLYAPVTDGAGFKSINDMRVAIRKVFSEDYSSVLEALAFDGQDGASFGYHNQPRYIDKEGELFVLREFYETEFDSDKYGEYDGVKVQKYDTSYIEIVKISKRFIEGKIKSIDKGTEITVTLILEKGEWRLDSPTY